MAEKLRLRYSATGVFSLLRKKKTKTADNKMIFSLKNFSPKKRTVH